ncbi:surface carbohydrate biosynthesis protein [Candidatus Pelagibacter sp. HIMB1495]|uniref:surface carbohydrate biosynthesis protein n=1 Tax=unclassified Candidatus Pelagibacter TaxID=2647897 RepID=UPI003F8576CB
MLTDQKKINIYIPIEIKNRELLSKVLLSNFLIKNNKKKVRCYIGSKTQIKKLISFKKSCGGVFIYKGGLSLNQLLEIKKKIEKFLILDEELGPAVDNLERSMSKRFWEGTEKYIDRLYVIGKYAFEVGKKVYPKLDSRIIMSGWPRVDTWRPELNYIFDHSVKKLRKKYGNFILFSSDFTFNSINRINKEKDKWRNSEWKVMSTNLSGIEDNAKKVFLDYQDTIKLMHELDKNINVPLIIIRPHPSDDLLEWRKLSKSFKKIKIIFQGEMSHWIYASSGVLHRGCTSAIEAYMAGIKTGHIITNKDRVRKSLSYNLSEHLYNSNQILEFCKKNIKKKPIPPTHYSELFNKFVNVEKKYASEIIAEDIINLDITSELPCRYNRLKYVLDSLSVSFINLKSLFLILLNKYKDNVLLPSKIYGGITKKEIERILSNISLNHNLKIRKVLKDCIEIE